jgi:hypothetical protein
MSHGYDARRRDHVRLAVTALTGLATAAAAGAVGVTAGLAARASAPDQPAEAGTVPQAAPKLVPRPRVVVRWKERPRRTVVRTRTVFRTAPTSLGGGSVGAAPVSSSSSSSGS